MIMPHLQEVLSTEFSRLSFSKQRCGVSPLLLKGNAHDCIRFFRMSLGISGQFCAKFCANLSPDSSQGKGSPEKPDFCPAREQKVLLRALAMNLTESKVSALLGQASGNSEFEVPLKLHDVMNLKCFCVGFFPRCLDLAKS